jgi:hypothetical protein
VRNTAPSSRPPLAPGVTHVLRFNFSCTANIFQKIRGSNGTWILMTADDYNQGCFQSDQPGWSQDGYIGTSVDYLTSWASAKTGHPVTLTRDKRITAVPGWDSPRAYQVTRAASR